MKKLVLPFVCCLAAVLLAGCAPASGAPASASLPGSSSPASVSQPAGEAANASESTEWTDEAVAELFLSQEENERRTVLDCAAVPDGGEELVGVVLYAEPEHTDVRLAFLSADGTFQPLGIEATPASPSGLAYLGEGRFRLDILDENGEPSGQIITFRRDGGETCFAVEPEE